MAMEDGVATHQSTLHASAHQSSAVSTFHASTHQSTVAQFKDLCQEAPDPAMSSRFASSFECMSALLWLSHGHTMNNQRLTQPGSHLTADQLSPVQLLPAAPLSGSHLTVDQLLPVQLLPATQFPDAGNHSASAALSSGCPVSASKNDVQTSAVKKTVKPVSDDYSALRIFLESLLPVSAPLSPPIVEDRATLVQKLTLYLNCSWIFFS